MIMTPAKTAEVIIICGARGNLFEAGTPNFSVATSPRLPASSRDTTSCRCSAAQALATAIDTSRAGDCRRLQSRSGLPATRLSVQDLAAKRSASSSSERNQRPETRSQLTHTRHLSDCRMTRPRCQPNHGLSQPIPREQTLGLSRAAHEAVPDSVAKRRVASSKSQVAPRLPSSPTSRRPKDRPAVIFAGFFPQQFQPGQKRYPTQSAVRRSTPFPLSKPGLPELGPKCGEPGPTSG